jgi:hypothetical protein
MEQTQNTTLTEAQACDVVYRGVKRENKVDSDRTLSYCGDAVKLQGFNVRDLAKKCQVRAEDKGESFNADSYQSNVSNANGIMALFNYDLEAFKVWLETSPTKSLKAIFNAFRGLFADPKPAKPKADKPEAGEPVDGEPTPLIDVVLSALPHLSAEERQLVAMMIIELDTAEADAEVVAA